MRLLKVVHTYKTIFYYKRLFGVVNLKGGKNVFSNKCFLFFLLAKNMSFFMPVYQLSVMQKELWHHWWTKVYKISLQIYHGIQWRWSIDVFWYILKLVFLGLWFASIRQNRDQHKLFFPLAQKEKTLAC